MYGTVRFSFLCGQVFDSNVDTDFIIKETLQEMVTDGYFIETIPDHYKVRLILFDYLLRKIIACPLLID